MKKDYSTFVQLPQKTSLLIDSQVNKLKNVTQINSVLNSKKTFVPYVLKGQDVGCTLIRVKRRKYGYSLSKTF